MSQEGREATPADSLALPVPRYLQDVYWWAYIHPRAVFLFEREWLVNLILFGNYRGLRDACLDELGAPIAGRTLQVACVYGNLSARLRERLAADALLDVVDVLPIQLRNLALKLPRDARVALLQGDACALPCADGHYDQVLLFFLLHEQPEAVRRKTLAEAVRATRPGGRIVIVDYHRPAIWHPLRPLMRLVLGVLEPYALDLWRRRIGAFLPVEFAPQALRKRTFFGGLYQIVVISR
jgi:ubiquinone/menaquinone biosynthesis C-methylase UbiE